MQDLYATTFQVAGEDLGSLYRAIGSEVVQWGWRGAGPAPDLKQEPAGDRDAPNGYGLAWNEFGTTDGDDRALEAVLRHPDPLVTTREWRSVVDVCLRRARLSVTVRVGRTAIELQMTPASIELRRPGLVPQLLNTFPCSAGGIDLTARPVRLHVSGVEDFVSDLLRSEKRALPAVLIGPGVDEPVVDATKVADQLAGLAHVAVLPGHLAWTRFREAVGDAYRVPFAGVRLYWPGFGNQGDKLRHRYWTQAALEADQSPIQSVLFKILSRVSVHAVPLDPLTSELRREMADERLRQLQAEGRSDAELLEHYAEENDRLIERLQELETLTADQGAELAAHRQNWAALATTLPESLEPEDDELAEEAAFEPKTWSEFADHLPVLETNAFVVTARAQEDCRLCAYPDPARMWSHLERLAEAADEWASQGCSVGMTLEDWLIQNYGLDIALHDKSLGPRASFTFDGTAYSREPHIKIDDAKSPNECGRIYFAVVSSEARFIVDHVGLHL
jgi:hypothetical protein